LKKVFDAEPGTMEGDELEILGTIIEAFENKYFSVEPPDPVEAIRFRMEQLNRS
jgi:HTH-type transcriptional regulator/antitoxin HigA